MPKDRWQPKVDALLRLAEDKGATAAERETAREKLALILTTHPEATTIRQYEPVRQFTMRDVGFMRKHGISTDGEWAGRNLHEAVAVMAADYRQRIAEFRGRKRLGEAQGQLPPVTQMSQAELKDAILEQLDAEIEDVDRLLTIDADA